MKWKHHHFPAGAAVAPGDVAALFRTGSKAPPAISFAVVELAPCADDESLGPLLSAVAHEGLETLLAGGIADNWFIGLAATSDPMTVKPLAKSSLNGMGERATATSVSGN